jgi:hypothetical protein
MGYRDEARPCPRCERLLAAREHRGGDGLALVWRCACGWAAVRTVSRELAFRQSRLSSAPERVDPTVRPALAKLGTKLEES